MISDELMQELTEVCGYFFVKEIPGRGICALRADICHVALLHGIRSINDIGLLGGHYDGEWDFPSPTDAGVAMASWDGEGDPPGNWDVYKNFEAGYKQKRNNPAYVPAGNF